MECCLANFIGRLFRLELEEERESDSLLAKREGVDLDMRREESRLKRYRSRDFSISVRSNMVTDQMPSGPTRILLDQNLLARPTLTVRNRGEISKPL